MPHLLSLNACVLASIDFRSPVLWAVLIGWILSVTLHEFAHGIVGYLGGDYTIRERGLLTLNPLKFVDPLLSIGLPLLFLLMGGVPLMGGATYIRNDLLRSRAWQSLVSLAGPATNFGLFLLCALPFHPRVAWIQPPFQVVNWTSLQLFLGAMVVLQFFACVYNMIPIPGLDGFGIIKPYFDQPTQQLLSSREVFYGGMLLLVLLFNTVPALSRKILQLEDATLTLLGFGDFALYQFLGAFNKALFNG